MQKQEKEEVSVEDLEAGLLLESCEEILRFGDKVSDAFPDLAPLVDKWAEAEKKADESFLSTSWAFEMSSGVSVPDQSEYDAADSAFKEGEWVADNAWHACFKWVKKLKEGAEP